MPAQPSPEAREECNALIEALMPFAKEMLKKHGELAFGDRSPQFTNIGRLLPLIAIGLLLLGCSRMDDFAGYDKQSGDLGAFILQHASKFGAHVQQTNGLPPFTADWRYKEDADGFQVSIAGNHFGQLQSFLTAAFGPPARSPTTNEMAGTKSIGAHYGAELGVALVYGRETTRDGKEFTSMIVVRQKR